MDFSFDANADFLLNRAMLQSWRVRKYSYKNNARLDYGFLYVLKGKITYTFDNNIIELGAGDIIYLPKGSYYEAEFDITGGEVINYLINFDVLNKEISNGIKVPFLFYSDSNDILSSYFKNTVEAFSNKDNPLLTKSFFYLLLHNLMTICNSDNEKDILMKKGAELLVDRCDMSIEDIAVRLHLSRSAFQKGFKDCFGVSPVKYRTEKRLEKAKLYLDTTDMPIKEIADKLGFYDISYFYKVFEKKYSLPPKKYRDNLKIYL